jgi:hypothetical protein
MTKLALAAALALLADDDARAEGLISSPVRVGERRRAAGRTASRASCRGRPHHARARA